MKEGMYILFNKTKGVIYGNKAMDIKQIDDIVHDRRSKIEWQVIPFKPIDLQHPGNGDYLIANK
ncbi:hypothetical protein [Pelosinus sp. IPA-1]|uniref:hypothetical protein n=1 Tax=Pelosinus sp. IPA-1 TaxID=3029569 RepID=UPI0024361C21|nr:hypothetical protein [Pelosinus sp. IPA-1]GMB01848.1 hypothetical protein PIPA1_46480 [Pelosinus sp. IPA-1]